MRPAFLLLAVLPVLAGDPAPPSTHARMCLLCHQPTAGNLRGNFDAFVPNNQSLQVRVDEASHVLRYEPSKLKVLTKEKADNLEAALKGIAKGHEVRVEFTETHGVKTATLLSVKPPVEIAASERITLDEVEKLVAQGPEKGKYFLFDSRPPVRFQEGNIPTAVNLPFPAFDKNVDKLPHDKGALVIFYCSGKTCNMSPGSLAKARKLGYTNVKVFVEGMPAWYSRNFGVIAPKSFQETYPAKDMPAIVVDLRSPAEVQKGFIKGAVAIPPGQVSQAVKDQFPAPKAKAPILVVDRDGGAGAVAAAKEIVKAGYPGVNVLAGGLAAWTAAGLPLQSGTPAAKVAFVPKPRPGSIPTAEFTRIAGMDPAQRQEVLILDVRTRKEAQEGMIKGALNIPQEELATRFVEVPKGRRILIHCSTGIRAEMAYNLLRDQGVPASFLNAELTVIDTGEFTVD
ncbi:MAG: sulfurtransferase [Acidobacteria bacterium]|nr:sulfurtransferase [Acidobacteriota bacterium]